MLFKKEKEKLAIILPKMVIYVDFVIFKTEDFFPLFASSEIYLYNLVLYYRKYALIFNQTI